MAKDPAFLFYPNDFTSGTRFMTNEQVGKYIRLLCANFDIGHLDEKHMLMICETYDLDIFSKFNRDSEGKYYNQRLEDEKIKRKNYCSSRSKNRTSKNNICNSYVPHMENENENINNNKEKGVKGEKQKRPTFEEILEYCKERNKGVDAVKFYNYYESNGWKVGKNPMKNWKAAVHTWEKNSETQQVTIQKYKANKLL